MDVRCHSPMRLTAVYLERNDMRALGVNRTARLARARNRRRREAQLEYRSRLKEHLAELEGQRRGVGRTESAIRMRDGWAVDESRSLPHLDALLDDMASVIEERGLRPWKEWGKPFLKDILPERPWDHYGSILDFASSPEVLEPLAHHAGFVPHLSGSQPPGVRLMESSTKYDPQPEGPWRASQLWHIDYHADPLIYVIVALRDIGPDDGALHFIGQEASDRIAAELGYHRRGVGHRISDEVMDAHVDPAEVKRFVASAGTVLFLDSSRCFHFGSRNPANPRYQMQYAFLSPIRNDFTDLIRPQAEYPVRSDDPLARRLALDRDLRAV